MFRWLRKKASPGQPLQVDMHSHLLPGLDDGVKTMEEAEAIILYFHKLGYRKLITTPHVMQDAYPNTPGVIQERLRDLQQHLQARGIDMEIQAAAEYYLDESLLQTLGTGQPMLTFGKRYLLFETNFLSEPFQLKEFIFQAATKGYTPVLAHPERYLYLQGNLGKVEDLLNRGVLMQLNISSITGYYSKPVQKMALQLIDRGWIHWLGSDCHHLQHVKLAEDTLTSRYFRKALTLPLLNNTLQ